MRRPKRAVILLFVLSVILSIIPVHAASGTSRLTGSAKRADDGSIRLTNKKAGQAGGIWLGKPIRTRSGFTLSFDYKAVPAGSSSGDGITVSFSPKKVRSGRTSFYGRGAYGVELDSRPGDAGDPRSKHVAVIRDSAANHLKSAGTKLVDDGAWHTAKVTFRKKVLTVYIDRKKLVRLRAADLPSTVFVGFTASGRLGRSEQLIRNIRLGRKYLDKADDYAREFTIRFDAGGGSVAPSEKSAKSGSAWGSLPLPSRSGYLFDGWYTDRSGGQQITSATKASSDLTVYARWNKEKVRKSVTGRYTDSYFRKNLSFDAVYDDGYFTKNSSLQQIGLARLSMLASAAAYDCENTLSTLNDCNDLLEKCGFSYRRFEANATILSNDRVSFTVGIRKDRTNGCTLVAVILAGTTSDSEWISNLNLGSGSGHAGFEAAEADVYKKLSAYLREQGVSGKVRFWITGHSRGAAVGSLLTKRLNSMDQYGKANVYTYTFASPAVSEHASEAGYENIFNYINPDDIVTDVPPASWGYRRCGRDIVLPPSAEGPMRAAFKMKTGTEYTPMSPEDKQLLIDLLSSVRRKSSGPLEDFAAAIAHAHCQTSYLCWLGAMH